MKNPRQVFIPRQVLNGEAKLVVFRGYVLHVEEDSNCCRVCFKENTSEKESKLVSVTCWKPTNPNAPDLMAVAKELKGQYTIIIATEAQNGQYINYTATDIIRVPQAK